MCDKLAASIYQCQILLVVFKRSASTPKTPSPTPYLAPTQPGAIAAAPGIAPPPVATNWALQSNAGPSSSSVMRAIPGLMSTSADSLHPIARAAPAPRYSNNLSTNKTRFVAAPSSPSAAPPVPYAPNQLQGDIYLPQSATTVPPMPRQFYIQATCSFQGNPPLQLSFNVGDWILVIVQDSSGWWTGLLGSSVGLFPHNYCTT